MVFFDINTLDKKVLLCNAKLIKTTRGKTNEKGNLIKSALKNIVEEIIQNG
mgnify:CR=1 FL=1